MVRALQSSQPGGVVLLAFEVHHQEPVHPWDVEEEVDLVSHFGAEKVPERGGEADLGIVHLTEDSA